MPNYDCPTKCTFVWSIEQKELVEPRKIGQWDPIQETTFEFGGNTWSSAGGISDDAASKLAMLWARVAGTNKSLSKSHVIGDLDRMPRPDTIVDQAFVDTMTTLDPTVFDFIKHDKVWDPKYDCRPWADTAYLATLKLVHPTYCLETSEIAPREDILEKYSGWYGSTGARRTVKASTIAGKLVWHDSFTRDVLCTEAFVDALKMLGVPEWIEYEIEVINDL